MRTNSFSQYLFVALLLIQGSRLCAQSDENVKNNGLKNKSFIMVGEWDTRHPDSQKMSVVIKGKVVWQNLISLRPSPGVIQEYDDVTMLPNGNIVYAQMSGAGMITPDKKIIWKFDCPKGTETHSCEPIGKDSVLMVLNGNPAKVLIINTATSQTLREIIIPTISTNTHGQFRHVRWTADKTIMVGLMKEGKVKEFDLDGKELWSVDAKSPWSAMKLKNGNVMFSGDGAGYTREVDRSGKTVWELTQADVPFKLYNTQTANRLANGNTIICSWVGGDNHIADWAGSVQAFEVTPAKKVVWTLSSWDNPDLGTCTAIQMLTKKGLPDPNDVQR
jgi:hypothetical protein